MKFAFEEYVDPNYELLLLAPFLCVKRTIKYVYYKGLTSAKRICGSSQKFRALSNAQVTCVNCSMPTLYGIEMRQAGGVVV